MTYTGEDSSWTMTLKIFAGNIYRHSNSDAVQFTAKMMMTYRLIVFNMSHIICVYICVIDLGD